MDGGGGSWVAWDARNGWLVTAGENSSVYWPHREIHPPPWDRYPQIVFAFRPEFGLISTDYLWLEPDPPPADIQPPPPRAAWLHAIFNTSQLYPPTGPIPLLEAPTSSDPPQIAYRLSIRVGVSKIGTILNMTLPLDHNGAIVPGARRIAKDAYHAELQNRRQYPDEPDRWNPYCVEPEEWYLGPLPSVRPESREPETPNGSQYLWYKKFRRPPQP